VAIANNGSALFAAGVGSGNGSKSFSASDAGIAQDNTFNVTLVGHKNNVAISAASHVTESWTTAGNEILGLAVFR
jgi:hypothetical protein